MTEDDIDHIASGCTTGGDLDICRFARAIEAAAIAAERERCKQVIRDTRDRSGVNDDGQSWLMRAGCGDFIAAIDAFPLPYLR